ncbi:DUF6583 family protein [Pseudalkalibacillus decolorationis]|uniref:DUF6583 family protein n=1 Tax=Pseudalkalibacillus decolorationis TaxID=163879 RepID=UPI002147868C|nr:DUF6583 family protein [Pseudalkalibacillus decolorationis]
MNETRNETSATLEPSQSPKRSKKPLIISLAVIFILGIGATAYAMFFNHSAKEMYFLAESNTFNETSESFNETFAVNKDLAEKTLEEKSKSTTDLGFKVEGLETIDPSMGMVAPIVNQLKLNTTTMIAPKESKGLVEVNLGLEGTDLVKLEAYQSDKLTGLSVPLLYDKYLYFKNEDFGKLMKRFDPSYMGPEKMDNLIQMQVEAMKSQEKLAEFREEYGKFLLENISEESVTEGKGELKGETYTKLTLELSEKEVQDLMKKLIDKVQKDKELKELLVDMSAGSGLAANPALAVSEGETDKDKVKEEMEKALKDMEDNLDKLKMPDGFKSTILVNDKDLIVKRDIDFKIGEKEELVTFGYSSHALRKDEVITDGKWALQVSPKKSEGGDLFKAVVELKGEPSKRDINGTFSLSESGELSGSVDFDATMSGKPEDMKIEFEVAVKGSDQPIPPVKGHFTRKVKDELDKGTYSASGEFGIEVDAGIGNPISAVIDYKNKTEFTDELKFPKLEDEGENISELSDAELQKIAAEIQTKIQQLMMNNQQLFN